MWWVAVGFRKVGQQEVRKKEDGMFTMSIALSHDMI